MADKALDQAHRATSVCYMTTECSLGFLLVIATQQGLCALAMGDDEAVLVDELVGAYPSAVRCEEGALSAWVDVLQRYLSGEQVALDVPLDVVASTFQQRVWDALCAIPYGETRTYGEIARGLGQPDAARAVGHACASNPVALVIPCHRAIRSDGGYGGYRWGLARKRALLEMEQKQQSVLPGF